MAFRASCGVPFFFLGAGSDWIVPAMRSFVRLYIATVANGDRLWAGLHGKLGQEFITSKIKNLLNRSLIYWLEICDSTQHTCQNR